MKSLGAGVFVDGKMLEQSKGAWKLVIGDLGSLLTGFSRDSDETDDPSNVKLTFRREVVGATGAWSMIGPDAGGRTTFRCVDPDPQRQRTLSFVLDSSNRPVEIVDESRTPGNGLRFRSEVHLDGFDSTIVSLPTPRPRETPTKP